MYNMTARYTCCSDSSLRQEVSLAQVYQTAAEAVRISILGAVRGIDRGVLHAYCSHSTAQTAFTQSTFRNYPIYATAIIGTVYTY